MNIAGWIKDFSALVWGGPLIVSLVGTGIFLTLRLFFIQIRGFRHAVGVLSGKYDCKDDPGEISHFKALTTALSATVGTGNIVGVAAAVAIGGPGAIFWMWITAVVGMATKFTCCTLAVHFRRVDERGETHAGPMHYIEMGLGPKFRWLAVLFAFFTATASFGIGNMFQANNIVSSLSVLIPVENLYDSNWFRICAGVIVSSVVGLVILGGIKRIAEFASRLVPFMCVLYVAVGVCILAMNISAVPEAFRLILYYAFNAPESVSGGLLGGVIRAGVARGLFSNEAGLGSAAIAHGAARTKEPVCEGLVAMLGPFIDTLIVCSITGLVIIVTGAHQRGFETGLLTREAFDLGISGSGIFVSVSIVLFAFSTLVSWSYYGDRACDYLFGNRSVFIYRMLYLVVIVIGSVFPISFVIDFCDAMNGLMALPNLVALLALSPIVVKLTSQYLSKY